MNLFKSHFWYHKNQRNGILFLVFLIIILQSVLFFVDFEADVSAEENSEELAVFQKELDSLTRVELENRKPKIYPFNPNYITDYKGEKLGMSLKEIDRLLAFRKKNKFVNSKNEFQKVTKISDSLLNKIAPYFKFPDWVVKRNIALAKQKRKTTKNTSSNKHNENFESNSKAAKIVKKNINTITFKELLKTPYIDYDLCIKIFNYRDEIAEFQDVSELKNINGFPLDKYDRIVLYLEAK